MFGACREPDRLLLLKPATDQCELWPEAELVALMNREVTVWRNSPDRPPALPQCFVSGCSHS
jgi:hypothetical protein